MAQAAIRQIPPPLSEEEVMVGNKNIELAFEFLLNEETRLEPPNGSTLMLLPDDDPDQVAANIALGLRAIERGENVYFRHVHCRPEKASETA